MLANEDSTKMQEDAKESADEGQQKKSADVGAAKEV
jgi:hypothetical protein